MGIKKGSPCGLPRRILLQCPALFQILVQIYEEKFAGW